MHKVDLSDFERKMGRVASQNAGCFGKQQYSSFSGAERAVAKMLRKARYKSRGGSLKPYRCKYCHAFHLGSDKE